MPSKTQEIDKCLVFRFGEVEVPRDEEITLNKFSEIPDLVKNLRRLKHGPKLKLGDGKIDVVTTKYQAGYSGPDARSYGYAESVMMEYGSRMMSHTAIREELQKLKLSSSSNPLFSTISDAVKLVDRNLSKREEAEQAVLSNFEARVASVIRHFPNLSEEKRNALAFKMLNNYVPSLDQFDAYFGAIVNNKLESLFEDHDPVIKPDVTSRILTIWFIAESFRYPPMMLYSMLLLHLYVNNNLTVDELDKALHPSEIDGSEKAQFYCYLRETELLKNENKFPQNSGSSQKNQRYLNSRKGNYEKTIQDIESQKLILVKKVRDSIYRNFEKLGYPPAKALLCANLVFRNCIRRYMIICVGEEAYEQSQPDLVALTASLGLVVCK